MSTGTGTVLWVASSLAVLSCSAPTLALLRPAPGPGSSPGSSAASPQALQLQQARLSVVDWNAYDERENDGPGTYSFGYEIEDPASANTQFRQEERFANGTVSGSYGLVEPDGNVRVVTYVADAQGYRARIENSLRKEENFPRTPTARPRPPPASDRLLQTANDVVVAEVGAAAASSPTPPLTWALLSLQAGGGWRPPVQEQRQRPASAAGRRPDRGSGGADAGRPQQPRRRQQAQARRGAAAASDAPGQADEQQRQQLMLLQQQLQLQNRQAWGGAGYKKDVNDYAAYGDAAAVVANDLGGRGDVQYDDAVYMSQGQDEGLRGQQQQRDMSWSANPIVVWSEPQPQPQQQQLPRYELPPIPLLDKLIYSNADGHRSD